MPIRLNLLIGCTACGKSAVGLELARRLGAEILSVDSMKIYRRMDVGTAKPTVEERARVRHHLIDIIEPSESYSLGRFVEDADRVIRDTAARNQPLVAEGGTMMFVRGLVSGVFDGPPADPDYRQTLRDRAAREGTAALHAELAAVDPAAAARIHPNDLRRIERAMEVYRAHGRPISELQTQWSGTTGPYDCRLAALRMPKEDLNRRINARVRQMIATGLVRRGPRSARRTGRHGVSRPPRPSDTPRSSATCAANSPSTTPSSRSRSTPAAWPRASVPGCAACPASAG